MSAEDLTNLKISDDSVASPVGAASNAGNDMSIKGEGVSATDSSAQEQPQGKTLHELVN